MKMQILFVSFLGAASAVLDKDTESNERDSSTSTLFRSFVASQVSSNNFEKTYRQLRFDIPGNGSRDEEVVRFKNVVFGYYSNKLIFRKINVKLDLASRVGMIGANGAGKSTFVKLVLRHLRALFGDVNVNRSCRITAFFQVT